MADLNDLIPEGTTWELQEGIDINDPGQIAGYGRLDSEHRYFLLTPVVCGDGAVQVGEECDDGNTMPGDGCDENCQVEMPIPTLSEWGVIAMTLLVLAAGTAVLRRRRAKWRAYDGKE